MTPSVQGSANHFAQKSVHMRSAESSEPLRIMLNVWFVSIF